MRTASAGGMARRSLGWFLAVLAFGAGVALSVPTLLLRLVPVPASAAVRPAPAFVMPSSPAAAEDPSSTCPLACASTLVDAEPPNDEMAHRCLFRFITTKPVERAAGSNV